MAHNSIQGARLVPEQEPAPKLARYWSLGLLAFVAVLGAVDRQAFSVLLVPIQRDLRVSDAAMGALTGSAFAIAYALMTIPLGRLSDRTNRRNLIAVAVAVWSCATAFTAFAADFTMLLLARLIVGAAESAQGPTTVSLIADLFDRSRRGTAFMFCAIGTAVGYAAGSYIAGALNDRYNWHAAMLVVGAPGLILAGALFFTMREPARTGGHLSTSAAAASTSSAQLKQCLSIRTIPPLILSSVALQASYTGWLTWFPAFLMRVHGLSTSRMGATFGVIILSSVLSPIWGAPLSDRLARRAPRWRLYFLVVVTLLSIPLLVASSLVNTLLAAQICVVGYALMSGCLSTVATATYMGLSPSNMRGFLSSLFYLANTIFGAAAAPAVFGLINDFLTPVYGQEAVRYTLLLSSGLLGAAAFFYWLASRTVDQDTEMAERDLA